MHHPPDTFHIVIWSALALLFTANAWPYVRYRSYLGDPYADFKILRALRWTGQLIAAAAACALFAYVCLGAGAPNNDALTFWQIGIALLFLLDAVAQIRSVGALRPGTAIRVYTGIGLIYFGSIRLMLPDNVFLNTITPSAYVIGAGSIPLIAWCVQSAISRDHTTAT